MANPKRRLPDNSPGDFYVDETCIDCDTCRWLAPDTFFPAQGQSAVKNQPQNPEARRLALLASVACPTASIGCLSPSPEMPEIRKAFPLLLEADVYYCGYHSPKSFGAASYLIRRPDGNVLVDSPRQSETLAKRIDALGGVRWLYLTHGDDIADHKFWHSRFGCDRIMHSGDMARGHRVMEKILDGEDVFDLGPDLRIIPVPGHTRGSTVLLYRNKFLFTGDHLAFSQRRGHLYAFRDACWYSWSETIRSMHKLKGYPFTWVLPGHGRRFHTESDNMQKQLEICIDWMQSNQP